MYFFVADEHYSHKNIIKHQGRPFMDVYEMDEYMIECHNAVVGEDDTTIHAGDFCWSRKYYDENSNDHALYYIERLNGKHVFLEGDHDKWLSGRMNRQQIWKKMIDGSYLVVCHYPIHSWPRSHYNSWHLYGHSHRDLGLDGKRYCISVENTDYFPVSFEKVKAIMERKEDNPNFISLERRRRR
jgi:calcineurin-like phosphoesterase family protein